MAERFTSDLLFILFVLLVAALLGFLIGYLLRKNRKCPKCDEMENENTTLKARISKLEDELASLKPSLRKLEDENAELRLNFKKLDDENAELRLKAEKLLAEASPLFAFNSGKAREALGIRVIENDLKIVEGIGPKISGILVNRGIKTWKTLSETDPSVIKDYMITDGGERYRIHAPDTWPEQAKLAHEGMWHELKAFQDKLRGGRLVS